VRTTTGRVLSRCARQISRTPVGEVDVACGPGHQGVQLIGGPLLAQDLGVVFGGYPVLVDTKRLDYRLASWIKTAKAVALAPGVYAAYNPAQADLTAYIDGPNDGDCAVRKLYFPNTGGACWSGVLAGPQEPK
jgi:hypothetical protein